MNQNKEIIQLDETEDNIPKFILSNQVPKIIGKEEQEFKLSMSQLIKQPQTPNNQIMNAGINQYNNSMFHINLNNFQNQTINNGSMFGQMYNGQQTLDLVSPKYYELDNEQIKNDILLSPHMIENGSNVQFFSSQQMLDNDKNGGSFKMDVQTPSQNNFVQFNSSNLGEQTSQTFQFLHANARNNPKEENKGINLNESNMRYLQNQRQTSNSEVSKSNQNTRSNMPSFQMEKIDEDDLAKKSQNYVSSEKQVTTSTKGTISLMKMAFVKNFVNKLIKRVRSIIFKKMTKQQFEIINDYASDFNYYIYQNHLIFSESDIILQDLNESDILLSFYWRKQIIFFSNSEKKKSLNIKNKINTHLLNLFSYLIYFMDRKDAIVAILYLLSKSTSFENHWINFLDYSIFCKIIDIPKKISEMEQKLQVSETVLNWLKLVKLECLVLLIAHIASCIFIRIALSEQKSGKISWIDNFHYDNNTIHEQYLISLYFMVITMTTTGYGDISPFSLYEKAFILIIALVSQNVCGYSFTTISEIVKTQSEKKKEFKQFMRDINKEMNNRNINILLQHKVTKFVEYQYNENIKKSSQQTNILEILPNQLKEEVLLDINKEMINHISFLSNLSEKCQKEIALVIKQKVFYPGEIILQKKGLNENLYYISQGTVVLSIHDMTINYGNSQQEMNLQTLKKQDVFGQQGFLFDQLSPYNAKTPETTVLSYLNKYEFLSILKKYQLDFEKCYEQKDKISLYQEQSIAKIKCISCGQQNHQQLDSCPFVSLYKSYVPKKINGNLQRQAMLRVRKRLSYKFEDLKQIALELMAELDQSVFSDILSVLYKSQENLLEDFDEKEKYNINLQENEAQNTGFQNLKKLNKERPKTLKPTYQSNNQYSTNETDNNDKSRNEGQMQTLRHAQSEEMIKHNQLDVIRENIDGELLLASQTPDMKNQIYNKIKDDNNIDFLLPSLKQFQSDIIYSTKENEIKKSQNQQSNIQKYHLNSDHSTNQRKKQTKELSSASIDIPTYYNQKSRDSIQNSIDLQISQSFLKNEEKKYLQNEQIRQINSTSSGNDIISGERKTYNQSKSPKKIEMNIPSHDSLISIEPLSGSKRRQLTSQGGLLFASRQYNLKRSTLIPNQINLIQQVRDESCELNTEKELSGILPPNDIYSQVFEKRQSKSQNQINHVNQEIFKRREEKRQSTFNKQINDSFTSSLRNITSNLSIKQKTYLKQQTGENSLYQYQANSPSIHKRINQQQQQIHQPAPKYERKQQKTQTISLEQQGSVNNINFSKKHMKRDSVFSKHNMSAIQKQVLQPYSVLNQEQRGSFLNFDIPKSPRNDKNIAQLMMSAKSQATSDYLHYLSQNSKQSSSHTHNFFNPSKFKQIGEQQKELDYFFRRINNNNSERSFNQFIEHTEIVQSPRTQIENQAQQQQEDQQDDIDENLKQSSEFQLRCQLGLQNLDLLVVRKFYQLAQQKKQKIFEIGGDLDYIVVDDNEMDIDIKCDYSKYFPSNNIEQKTQQPKKTTTRKSRKTQYNTVIKQNVSATKRYTTGRISIKLQN